MTQTVVSSFSSEVMDEKMGFPWIENETCCCCEFEINKKISSLFIIIIFFFFAHKTTGVPLNWCIKWCPFVSWVKINDLFNQGKNKSLFWKKGFMTCDRFAFLSRAPFFL